MALRREIDHHVRVLLFKQLKDSLAVGDARLHKAEVRFIHDRG